LVYTQVYCLVVDYLSVVYIDGNLKETK